MPHALTEDQAAADFATAPSMPDNGADSFRDAVDIWEAAMLKLANRSQRSRLWLPDTQSVKVPLLSISTDSSSGFNLVYSSDTFWYNQNVLAPAALYFEIPTGHVGRKITGATAWWIGSGTIPLGTAPKIAIHKLPLTVGATFPPDTLVGEQSDTSASTPVYQAFHKIVLTGLSETIVEDAEYYIACRGESGTNSQVNSRLYALRLALGI